jgi:arsenite/tail-anchored protein-transporting ATPase
MLPGRGVLLMLEIMKKAPRFVFFTGKGGVGKTSISCMLATALADQGKKVLLISTDPASNLDEVLEADLTGSPSPIPGCDNLWAMNIDPIDAAESYKERIVGPYRGVLPDESIAAIEEQLSGACTVEIAAFNEFSGVIGNEDAVADYDQVILDTAPTGHTLRLLNLPAAWNDFVLSNASGSSCLGPMSGLTEQRRIYEKAVDALTDAKRTLLVLVARPEPITLEEAARAAAELADIGIQNQHLIVNGVFESASSDPVAVAFTAQAKSAMASIPENIAHLPRTRIGFRPEGLIGIESLRNAIQEEPTAADPELGKKLWAEAEKIVASNGNWKKMIDELETAGKGLVMCMGKGGVGKTTMAVSIAVELARRGHPVHLSTTDPAAHIDQVMKEPLDGLEVSRIDPKAETGKYVQSVIDQKKDQLSPEDMELLKEELRSPCIEEIAVFQAFARVVDQGKDRFIVLDTAPTGHTLLLMDATEAYHREVEKNAEGVPAEVRDLLPRLRDPKFTKIFMVTLAQATPVHEARRLEEDLERAGIRTFGWIVNQSFAVSKTIDPALASHGVNELRYIREVQSIGKGRVVVVPWIPSVGDKSIIPV